MAHSPTSWKYFYTRYFDNSTSFLLKWYQWLWVEELTGEGEDICEEAASSTSSGQCNSASVESWYWHGRTFQEPLPVDLVITAWCSNDWPDPLQNKTLWPSLNWRSRAWWRWLCVSYLYRKSLIGQVVWPVDQLHLSCEHKKNSRSSCSAVRRWP